LVPLEVDRLAGRQGPFLVAAMQQLTEVQSAPVDRIRQLAACLQEHSELGYGLLMVGDLWDEVFAWAAASPRGDEAWYRENLPLIDAYLVGATIFRYVTVMGDRYRRAALLEALSAGSSGASFPLERILAVARAGSGLRGGRQAVRSLDDAEERQWTADHNGPLLTTLSQRLPFQLQRPIDWDHIFPAAQAGRMWTPGLGRRRHHPDRRLVNSAGNFWALDFRTNRALQDDPPGKKFEKLSRWLQNPDDGYPVWSREHWSLAEAEVDRFIEVDQLLTDDAASVERGMTIFRDLVIGRAQRLLDEALARFPHMRLFAADADIHAEDATAAHQFAASLGITVPDKAATRRSAGERGGAGESDLGSDWAGGTEWLVGVLKEVTKRLTIDPRSLPTTSGEGFTLRRWVRLGAPDDQTHCAIGITTRFAEVSATPLWLQVNESTPGFDIAEARILASRYGSDAKHDTEPQRVWLPLEAPTHLKWDELIDHLEAQARQIKAVIIGIAK
jgi:hypothetical protein